MLPSGTWPNSELWHLPNFNPSLAVMHAEKKIMPSYNYNK